MNLIYTAQWYIGNALSYGIQMLPCMCAALIFFLLIRPCRVEHLNKQRLQSRFLREATLLFFVMFCGGLASLTLFPADFWRYLIDRGLNPEDWWIRWNWKSIRDFYPSLSEILASTEELHNLLTPFQEIRRAMLGISWLVFVLLGNIIMFVPIGFFASLLWRKARWYRALLIGLLSSSAIETVQFFIGRRTDIDDIILNTLGVLIGFWLYRLFQILSPESVSKFQCCDRKDELHGSPDGT